MGAPPQIEVAVLGWSDSLLLVVLGLVLFGPRKLGQIGRQIGKLMYEFRKASNDFKFQMEEELRAAEEADRRKKQEEDRLKAQAAKAAEPPALPPPQPATPYSEDVVYPPSAPAAETHAEVSAPDSTPRIQPPSTGEQVAAERPHAPMTKPEIYAANTAANASSNGAGSAHSGAMHAESSENGASLNQPAGTQLPGAEHSEETETSKEQAAQHG